MREEQPFSGEHLPELLLQISEGRQTAFREVYVLFYKRLFHFAFAIVKTRELSEEIVEDVFVKLWQKHADARGIQNLRVYLYTATKNTALNYLSKKARESITEPFDHIQIELNDSAVTPEQILITAEMYKKIQAAVEALPPRCKMIFKLVREDGLRYKEIAEILNISVNTIDVQMAIAVKRIASALEADLGYSLQKKPLRK
ncbi:MAG: RNA polymerase sigma-70 factor [Chitinophagaceae bacterium]|nr:RNA polymerase sigma-70 factor [Chitinophagaceae bacterium]